MTYRCPRLPCGCAVLLLALSVTLACGDPILPESDAAGTATDAGIDAIGDACMAEPFTSAHRDIDILFVVATSASMATIDGDASQGSRWDAASSAIRALVAGLGGQQFGAGLLFFPLLVPEGDGGNLVEACSGSDYLAPALPIAPLDADGAHAAAFEQALGSRSLQGGNAMAAALAGALRQAARVKASTGHIVQTVLVTDGALDPCGAAVTGAATAADAAFQTDHLETYVLGIGPDGHRLDPIAAAGGTFHTYTGNDAVAPALATMGAAMRRCKFFFPMVLPPSGFSRISMVIDYGKGGMGLLPLLLGGSSCQENQGWFYNSPTAPAYAVFCPATCDVLLQSPGREVSALLGCF